MKKVWLELFDDAVRGKIVFGVLHSILGAVLVWFGTYRFLERFLGFLVAGMVAVVVVTGLMIGGDLDAILAGLTLPRVPDQPEATAWTLALMGGVGGTLTVLCYGYWIRERGRRTLKDLQRCRWDIAASYAVMAMFGIAMVIIADGMTLSGKGATLVVDLANRLGEQVGSTGRLLFLWGAWAAVFSSLVGVWQAVPYLFADFWTLIENRESLDAEHFRAYEVDSKGWVYRGYLLALTLVPLLGLRYDFQLVQKLNSVFGALVMPMLALALLLLNGRSKWVGEAACNRWPTNVALVAVLLFFAWVGLPKIVALF